MKRESTFLHQFNDSKLASDDWEAGYSLTQIEPIPTTNYRGRDMAGSHSDISRIYLQWTNDQEVVCLPELSFYTTIGKRIVDIALSGLVTVFVLSWLIPIIGSLILCESPGPFFFIQSRSGRKGRPFLCLKFRTMVHSTSLQAGFRQTSRDDERVTVLGRFLRKTNLDEMPQFLNVLIGDMTIVGPRPHAIWHDAQHWASAGYRERYWVRPGITGLAQIRGARGEVGEVQKMKHRIRYDHFYIPRQTFLLDMKICFWTLKLMFKGDMNAW